MASHTAPSLGLAILLACSFGCGDGGNKSANGTGGTAGAGMGQGGTMGGLGGIAGIGGGPTGQGGAEVAGAWTATCADEPPEEGFEEIPANDPNIRYVGRVNKTDTSVSFAFPAVQIQARFQGDAIDMRLRDYGKGTSTATNFYLVYVDSREPTTLETCPEREVYPLARNLEAGEHSLTIVKKTESGPGGNPNTGKGEFLGFRVRPGATLGGVVPPTRRVEFVGDSITCGYGNEVSTTDPDSFKFTAVHENAWLAYGAVTARALSADYVAVAASGRGVMRNYDGFAGTLVPEMYELALPEDSDAPTWDHTSYEPDIIVINLGTNDFSIGIPLEELPAHRAAFRAAYQAFLTRLRSLHPQATLVVALGPMMSDSYPEGYDAWTSIREDLGSLLAELQAAGDSNLQLFVFDPQSSPYGEDWHPTIQTHQSMADELVPFLAQLKGW